MSRGRRLTETERLSIANERTQGVAAADLAARYGVSLKSIYNAANHARERQLANGSRPRVIGLRVSEQELERFDAALYGYGIVSRTEALRGLMAAADKILKPGGSSTGVKRRLTAIRMLCVPAKSTPWQRRSVFALRSPMRGDDPPTTGSNFRESRAA